MTGLYKQFKSTICVHLGNCRVVALGYGFWHTKSISVQQSNEIIEWLRNNIEEYDGEEPKYSYDLRSIHFRDESDAFQFKLRWC